MLQGVHILPTRYPAGTILSSLQHRRIQGSKSYMDLSVGASLTVPPHCKKVMITERYGDLRIDYFYLGFDKSHGKPNQLYPAYFKLYQFDSNVLLTLPGLHSIFEYTTGVKGHLVPLKRLILRIIQDEVTQTDTLDTIREWAISHVYETITNDEVSGFSDMDDPNLADYPWNMGNFTSKEMMFQMIENHARAPIHLRNYFEELSPTVTYWRAGCSPLHEALDDFFGIHTCNNFDWIGIPKLVDESSYRSKILFKDALRLTSPKGSSTVSPRLMIKKDLSCENLTVFSTEILKLCVWLHQSPFSELSFKTILPNGKDPISIRLYTAVCETVDGVDLSLMNLELQSLLLSWDSGTYKELIVTKTMFDEVFIQLVGRDPSLNKCWYIDLFFTTVLSQALIRQI